MSDKDGVDIKSKEEDEAQQEEGGREERPQEPEEDENLFSRDKFCDSSCYQCALLIKNGQFPTDTAAPLGAERKIIFKKAHIEVLYQHLETWVDRPCDCLYREPTLIEGFGLVIRHLIKFSVQLLKNLEQVLSPQSSTKKDSENPEDEEKWNAAEIEKLLLFLAKVFMLHFPFYAGPKQVGHRYEELSTAEATQLAVFCEVHDSSDFPVALLRNATLFCKSGGLQGMANAFKLPSDLIPPSMAYAFISILCNIKLWLNYRAVLQLFGPVRSNALHYMCGLSDQELRTKPARDIADFLWCSVKDNMDSSVAFDKDGLDLAFKYFSSTTLTMRLTGIMQMISQINSFNDMCNTDSVVEVENVGLQLANWILQNRIVEHLFGPNLHVEVIKQSLTLLNFLAVEGKITNEHINVVWQASQLKHCARQVQDLLLHLIKNLEAGPVIHLYELMHALPVREHTEQTIHLAQVLQKFIWTSGGGLASHISEVGSLQQQNRMPSKAESLSSSDEEDHSSEALSAKEKNKKLLRKSVRTTSSDCDYSLHDLEDLYDEANVGYTDDEEVDDEEEEDEDEEEEEDEEMMTTDEEEERRAISIGKSKPAMTSSNLASKLVTKKILSGKNDGNLNRHKSPVPSTSDSKEEGPSRENLPRLVEASDSIRPSSSGKRTKGIPVKGVKRNRLTDSSGSEEEGDNVKKKFSTPFGKKGRIGDDKGIQGEVILGEKAPCWWPSTSLNQSHSQPIVGTSTAMTELANLVNAHPRSARPFGPQAPEVLDMRPVIRNLSNLKEQNTCDDRSGSGENESMSSRLSDKNLGDFEDENSVDEEMLQLAQSQEISAMIQQQQLASMALYHQQSLAAPNRLTARQREESRIMGHDKLENACERGNTLLWDLLQDGNIEQLADGLVNEAEKALTSLLCYNMERLIRMKFIEGCLNNIANNTSVAISLRLLPKLIQSFQHFRSMDTHEICLYIEKRHSMTQLFFNNLKIYSKEHKEGKECPYFNHLVQIQIRLQFLTIIFSVQVSPMETKLTSEQIHILWECLAYDPVCSDDLFQYLLVQVHSKEQHAIGLEGFRLIYNEKLPTLKPETISMLGLNLFSQLCQLSRLTQTSGEGSSPADNNVKMDQLWKIALCAQNTDVSMKAIQILNSALFGQGEEFINTCMSSLSSGLDEIAGGRDEILIRIQRALLLLKTYLEMYRKKYAYFLRRMSIEGHGVSTHAELVDLRSVGPMKISVQTAGFSEKVTLEMQAVDLVADLRAEISAWWEGKLAAKPKLTGKGKASSPLLDSMLNDGPLRLITQGQELSPETDEKTLLEMGFKDCQLVFVSQGATRSGIPGNGNNLTRGDIPPFPGQDKMPMNLLLQPDYFNLIFSLMKGLTDLRQKNESGDLMVVPKAQILSRRVWDILMLLPTNPVMKKSLQNISKASEDELKCLLIPESPQRLMYIFYIVDWLGRPTRFRRHSGVAEQPDQSLEQPWMQKFIAAGGIKLLFDIFASGQLQIKDSSGWCEWKQDCLSALLKLLVQFGVDSQDYESLADILVDQSPRKKLKRLHGPRHNSEEEPRANNHLLVPRLSPAVLQLVHVSTVMPRLSSVLLDASRNKDPSQYRTGLYGRSQVVHFAMSFLLSWLFSVEGIDDILFGSTSLPKWLRNLLLDDPDPSVRREVCTGVYKMCLGSTTNGMTGVSRIGPLLSILTEFLDEALTMTPNKRDASTPNHIDDGKEPFGPACRDYFWIMCRLVDNINSLSNQSEEDSTGLVDLDQLSRQLACGIVSRKLYEKRHGEMIPDDALVGALNLLGSVMKHEPPFKTSNEGEDFILHLWECLFALPNPADKDFPKCKSHISRSACYDVLIEMVKGSLDNYLILHEKLMEQHKASAHLPYPWDYWPQEDGRAECGYVGLTNLGATCYLASCMQHLYMIPETRDCILSSTTYKDGAHQATLSELQKMFTYLRESERKAYSPLSFCKTYEMDKKTLNTGEQKDMTEFLSDLLSKMEEMTPELKKTVGELFGGTLTNNVVSLDCEHVSSTLEQFYSVRCPVAEKRNLQQSLEEVTVKDTLEGDNMYTCQCGKKVRAEKRACFKRLPKILAFNTMRYTFNFNTMLKEKVNTHFSFPFRLDMSPYMEENLIPSKEEGKKDESNKNPTSTDTPSYEYELIGVTVHTGTADGGHYYAFIRDRTVHKDKWYSFNDAEVKPFDPNQIAAECFGGEMNSRTYDQVTDKFLDLSIEKTNSAYMVFYERVEKGSEKEDLSPGTSKAKGDGEIIVDNDKREENAVNLSKELEEWIWKDNMNFVQDNNIFNHTYFNFMWQMVGFVPTTLIENSTEDITLLSAKLATSFFLESFIHAKEKLNIVQWVELLTKQFDSSTPACKWFLDHMASDTNWPTTIFLKCQIATIRQMFHRLCIHVIQKLRTMEKDEYLLPWKYKDPGVFPPNEIRPNIGSASSVTRFIKMLFGLLESSSARPHFKYWTEFFRFLYDFAKLGEEETRFLLSIRAISSLVSFYLKTIKQSPDIAVDVMSDEDDDDDDDIIALPMTEGNKMASLDKMIFLIALLVEKSRGDDNKIHLDPTDLSALVGSSGKSLVFLFNITKDNINICQTCNLIFSLSRNNPELAEQVTNMVFHGVKNPDYSMHFSRLISFLTEFTGGPSGMPCYTSLVMRRIWELAKHCPQIALEWLCHQVSRNRYVQTALLSTMEDWVETYLMAHQNQKVRNSTALLVVSLVPSPHFKQTFRSGRALLSPLNKETMLTREEVEPLHQILEFLFSLLPNAQNYVDIQIHGSGKLVAYFQAITHCLLGRKEKRMFEPHFENLWNLFHPKLSEPSISIHHNKQALLNLWYTLCVDCPENVRLIHQNPHVVKYIAFNYILADHEDAEVINFNRVMLPAYYGLLRMCCLQSKSFTRLLARHQNIQWAFKNITPYTTQYTLACEELFKLMALFVQKYPEMTSEEEAEIRSFRHQTLQLYLSILDGRSTWSTLINVLKVLIATDEDRIFVVYNNGLALIFDAINMLHVMFHEATACHVSGELIELIGIFQDLLKAVRSQRNNAEITQVLSRWKDIAEMTGRMLTLCNSYTQHDMREVCISVVREMLMLWPQEMLNILVPLLHRAHSHSAETEALGLGPFFPRKGNLQIPTLKAIRPPRPMIQMSVPNSQLESPHGQDVEYDKALQRYFHQYHTFIDLIVRIAVNEDSLSKMLVDLSAMVGLDGVPLHFQLFPKLWMDIYNTHQIDRKFIAMLLQSQGFLEYVDLVLHDDRSSLNNQHIYQFLDTFFPKVSDQILTEEVKTTLSGVIKQFIVMAETFVLPRLGALRSLNGDLRALCIVNSAQPLHLTPALLKALTTLRNRIEKARGDLDEELDKLKTTEADDEAMDCSEEQPQTTKSTKSHDLTSKIRDEKLKLKESYEMLLKTLEMLVDLNQKHCGIIEEKGDSPKPEQGETSKLKQTDKKVIENEEKTD